MMNIKCFIIISITQITTAWHMPCYQSFNCPKRNHIPIDATTVKPPDSDIVKAGFHFTFVLLFITIVFSFFGGLFICGALCANHGGVRPLNQVSQLLNKFSVYFSYLYFSAFDLNLSHRLVYGNLSDSVTLDGSIKSLFIGWRGGIFNVSNSSVFPSICHLRAKLVDTKLYAFTSPAWWDNSNQAFCGPDNLHLDHFGTFCLTNGSLGKFLGRFSSLSIITAKLWNGFLCGFSHFSVTKLDCYSNLYSIHKNEVFLKSLFHTFTKCIFLFQYYRKEFNIRRDISSDFLDKEESEDEEDQEAKVKMKISRQNSCSECSASTLSLDRKPSKATLSFLKTDKNLPRTLFTLAISNALAWAPFFAVLTFTSFNAILAWDLVVPHALFLGTLWLGFGQSPLTPFLIYFLSDRVYYLLNSQAKGVTVASVKRRVRKFTFSEVAWEVEWFITVIWCSLCK